MSWQGSSKDIRRDARGIIFTFTNRMSVLDVGSMPCEFPGIDVIKCAIATKMFRVLGPSVVETHFIERLSETEMLVQPFDIPEIDRTIPGSTGRLLPLEFLFRFVVTEKLLKRIQDGDVNQAAVEQLLVGERGLEVGARLDPAFVECSTKHQAADTYVSDERAMELARIAPTTFERCKREVAEAAKILQLHFRSVGFDQVDGKFEGALRHGSPGFVVADSISPDELRLIGPDGRSYDKDPLRTWYEQEHPDWFAALKAAKKKYPADKSKWPTYQAVPPGPVIDDVIDRYHTVGMALNAL